MYDVNEQQSNFLFLHFHHNCMGISRSSTRIVAVSNQFQRVALKNKQLALINKRVAYTNNRVVR